ncbi:MAG: hypothetical protein QXU02_01855 [Candidatus Bathyarchaeia archaeon]
MFEEWIEKNMAKISLYFRSGSGSLKFRCPLCGKPLRKRSLAGKFECRNPKCKLIYVELREGEVRFHVEPIMNIKYDISRLIRVEI